MRRQELECEFIDNLLFENNYINFEIVAKPNRVQKDKRYFNGRLPEIIQRRVCIWVSWQNEQGENMFLLQNIRQNRIESENWFFSGERKTKTIQGRDKCTEWEKFMWTYTEQYNGRWQFIVECTVHVFLFANPANIFPPVYPLGNKVWKQPPYHVYPPKQGQFEYVSRGWDAGTVGILL